MHSPLNSPIWHPCTQMKEHEDFPPLEIARGKGIYLHDRSGKRYIDAVSSWWTNLLGHANPAIGTAIQKQAKTLEHVMFAGFTHKPAIELAERLMQITPRKITKVFFADNGSSAIEAALKMSFQYHQQKNRPSRTRFLYLDGGYHGETVGAMSVGGCDLYTKKYRPLLFKGHRVAGPACTRCPYGKDRTTCNAECLEPMQTALEKHHDRVCGVIIEPMVQAANRMNMYSPEYLKKLRRLCSRYGVHLIADEIAVGFGRTGKMFGFDHAGITPDIMTVSKGITGGYLPLSAVLTTQNIYNAFYGSYDSQRAFLHSHSYCGNPLGCAAGCAAIDTLLDGRYLDTALDKQEYICSAIEILQELPFVHHVRVLGLIAAFDVDLKQYNSKKGRFAWTFFREALTQGAVLRPLANTVYFFLPHIIRDDEIDRLARITRKTLIEVMA